MRTIVFFFDKHSFTHRGEKVRMRGVHMLTFGSNPHLNPLPSKGEEV